MPRRSKIERWSWSPSRFGAIVAGSKPNWTVWVKNIGTEACGADVTIALRIPATGGTIIYQTLFGSTPNANENEVKPTPPMPSDFTGAVPGTAPYDIQAVPAGGGTRDLRSSSVVVVGA